MELTLGSKVKVLGIRKVYELPNPNSLVYSHDCPPFARVKMALISSREVV